MGEVCAARDRLTHRDRIAWMHTAHLLATMVNINRKRNKPFAVEEFYPYDLDDKKIELPQQEHEDMFAAMKQMMQSNGTK